MRRNGFPNYVRRTGAQFENSESFLKNTIVVDSTKSELKRTGIPLTYVGDNEYATSQEELHCFVIGDSGCGKTRRIILPTIRLMAKTGESMVIADPKGELYRNTAGSLREKGYKVQVLNFRNPTRGNRWNPLGIIDSYFRSGDPERRDKAIMMLDDMVCVLQEGKDGKDPYWIQSAGNVMRGISFLILEYGMEGDLTFENIALVARTLSAEIEKLGSSIMKFLNSLPQNSPIIQNLSVIIKNAKDTRNCIMSVFETMISMYYNQETLMDLFSTSEIDAYELGHRPVALFFILPDDTEALYPIATVFVKQVYSMLVSLADSQPNGMLPNRVTFLLDEFANFAKMPSIESMLTAARSRGIRFVLVCQSMDQLTRKYEDHGRETLLANCRVWVYMSCRNLPFLERLERLIGSYISPYTNESCPLIDIGSLQHFDKEKGEVLILNDRCRPMIGYLKDYGSYDFGTQEESVLEDLPAPCAMVERRLFDLEAGIERARSIPSEKRKPEVSEKKNERNDLRSSIFAKIHEKQSRTGDGEVQKERSDATSDRTTIEYHPEDRSEGVISDHGLDPLQCFYMGNYRQGIQILVDSKPGVSISDRNNIAFLKRFGKVDTSDIKSPFSLEIDDLLSEGVKWGEGFSLTNQALYEIERKNYGRAVSLFSRIHIMDWVDISSFWYDSVYCGKNQHPEGALICLIAKKYRYKMEKLSDKDYTEFLEKARSMYGDFLDSKEYNSINSESNQGGGQRESVGVAASEKMEDPEKPADSVAVSSPDEMNRQDASGVSAEKKDDEKKGLLSSRLEKAIKDEEDSDDNGGQTSATEEAEDFKKQLQKKIQEKIAARKKKEEENDGE